MNSINTDDTISTVRTSVFDQIHPDFIQIFIEEKENLFSFQHLRSLEPNRNARDPFQLF